MPTNVEIKAFVPDRAGLLAKARELATEPELVLKQRDVFYEAKQGRLKLRQVEEFDAKGMSRGQRGELIFYDRPDTSGPKQSNYAIYRTADPGALDAVLLMGLASLGVVSKTRVLLMVKYWPFLWFTSLMSRFAWASCRVSVNLPCTSPCGLAIICDLVHRVHVDQVDGLGDFMLCRVPLGYVPLLPSTSVLLQELEVVMKEGQSTEEGQ
eukprot:gene5449-5452_t